MPAMHSFNDMTTNTPGYNDEHRAIQIALELSMMGIGTEDEPTVSQGTALSQTNMDVADAVRKKSANMTECVPVPSSEHVAEIVGRQGCKIKALRAKTNTYIKTPVRGEEPVFVVTGRKEDVGAAKREILSAAEHFSQIRASRRNSSVSSMSSAGSSLTPGPPSPNAPGQVTIQVRVPYRVVGLVVGPKGATIKRIQQQTQTYIVTPSRDKEPVFEVTGLTENVEKARQEIESHIAIRTGGIIDNQNEDDFRNNGIDSGFHELNGDFSNSMNKPNSMSALGCNNVYNALNGGLPAESNIFSFPPVHRSTKISEFSNFSGGFSSLSSYGLYDDEGIGSSPPTDPLGAPPTWPDFHEKNKNFFVPNIFGSPTSSNESSSSQSTNGMNCNGHRLSPTLTDATTSPLNGSMNGSLNGSGGSACSSPSPPSNPTARRTAADSVVSSGSSLFSMSNLSQIPKGDFDSSSIICTSGMTSTIDVTQVMNGGVSCPMQVPTLNGQPRRQCFMCSESDIVAALVPCGHNFFCMECANLIVEKPNLDRCCPVCHQKPTQAIRIFS